MQSEFHKESLKFNNLYPDGQQNCTIISLENKNNLPLQWTSLHTGCAINFQQYVAGKPFPNKHNAAVLVQNLSICLLSFQSDKSNSEKGQSWKGRTNDNSYTNMANTTLVSSSIWDFNAILTAVDTITGSTVRSSRKKNISSKRNLILATWKVTGTPVRWNEFHAMQPSLYLRQEDRVLLQVTNWYEWTSWCVRGKIDSFYTPLNI